MFRYDIDWDPPCRTTFFYKQIWIRGRLDFRHLKKKDGCVYNETQVKLCDVCTDKCWDVRCREGGTIRRFTNGETPYLPCNLKRMPGMRGARRKDKLRHMIRWRAKSGWANLQIYFRAAAEIDFEAELDDQTDFRQQPQKSKLRYEENFTDHFFYQRSKFRHQCL